MDYKKLIAESWGYTQANKKLIRWFGFFPALFTTTVGVGYMLYQFFAFKASFLFSEKEDHFLFDVLGTIWEFVKTHVSWTLPFVIVGIIFLLFYLLFPTLAKASAIQTISRNRTGQKDAGVGTGLKHGIMSYLPLFEFHLLIKAFAFFSILIEMSFVIRNLGISIFQILLPVFILAILISLFLMLLFVYTDLYIVIDDLGVFQAMKASAKLVVTNWTHTFLITILMVMIGIRILIQAFFVFLVPILIVGLIGYITSVALPITAIAIGGGVGVIALFVAAYINGIVDVFSYAVWTFTFLELTSQQELSARGEVIVDDIGEGTPADHHDELDGHENLE